MEAKNIEAKKEKINKRDWIEIDYTCRIIDTNEIFDTTLKEVAEKAGIANEKKEFKPLTICVGENFVPAGLDEYLIGKEVGFQGKIALKPEKAFGFKNPKFVTLISRNKFLEQGIEPVAGLNVVVDGLMGRILTVTGGRVLVDFNHPLAGKDVEYEFKINRKVEDKKDQLAALFKFYNIEKEFEFIENANKAKIKLQKEEAFPKEFETLLISKAKDLIGIDLEFITS